MNSFVFLLNKLDRILYQYNFPNYDRLSPPLSLTEIEYFLNELQIKNEDFQSLFNWKNGFDFTNGHNIHYSIFQFGALLSLEKIIDYKNINDNQLKSWERTFIPLVTNGAGDFILFNNAKGLDYGKLHLFSASLMFIERPVSYYDSISAMIETTIKGYELGIIKYEEEDDWLNIDTHQYHLIAKRINQNSKYWSL